MMIVKRQRLLEIHHALTQLAEHARGVKLAYAIARNLGRLREEVEATQKAGTPSRAFQEFDQARLKFCQALCTKDNEGRPLIEQGQFILGENQPELDRLVDKLKGEYVEAISEREKQLAEWRTLLDGEADAKFHLVALEDVESGISADVPSLALLLEPLLGYVIPEG